MHDAHGPGQNHLLHALNTEEKLRLLPYLELVHMPCGHILHGPGTHMHHVYFPTTAILSRRYQASDCAWAEIAVVGNEGFVGLALITGGESSLGWGSVLSAGHGYRIIGQRLRDEFDQTGPMAHRFLRYIQAKLTLVGQTAVCNRHHSLAQRLCRWLLLCLDRLQGSELVMTQELLAKMLGVHREGVTEAAGKLQRAGVIEYHRGHLTVFDRTGLEQRACECYAVVKKEYDRLLPSISSP